jgi:SAM-dependent methyltransferase
MENSEYQKLYELEDSYWWFVGRRKLVEVLIETWIRPEPVDPILDVGCGTGGNLTFLANWGREAGIDLSPIALGLARCRRLADLAQASGLALPYADSSFGLVTAFDVLYHRWITNDDSAVQECYRVLRPGGWLMVMDSALPALWSHHDEVFYARQRYSLEEMYWLLTDVGFKPRKLSYANTLLLPLTLAMRLMGRWVPSISDFEMQPLPAWVNSTLTGILNLEAHWLRRGTFPIGSSVVCLAQKPVQENATSTR